VTLPAAPPASSPLDLADLNADDNTEKVRASLGAYHLAVVTDPDSAEFDAAYRMMEAYFGPKGEIERRSVLEAWLRQGLTFQGVRVAYHLVTAHNAAGALAGVRDAFVATALSDGTTVVLLSHSFILPSERRSGLAALFRTIPATLARRSVAELGHDPATTDVVLISEMEHVRPDDPSTVIRLLAYGRGGFRIVLPSAMPYVQPDFRDLDALGEEADPVPLLPVVRWLGHEQETQFPSRLCVAILDHLEAIHSPAARHRDLAFQKRLVKEALRYHGASTVPLLPIPAAIWPVTGFFPFLRARVLSAHPIFQRRGLTLDIPGEEAALTEQWRHVEVPR